MPSRSWKMDATAENVGVLRRAVAEFATAHDVPAHCLHDVNLAVSEAVSNVVVHAFRDGAAGTVDVLATVTPDRGTLDLTVADNGGGLVPRDDSPGLGLGLGLIRHMADESDHRAPAGGGTAIWMRFRFPPVA